MQKDLRVLIIEDNENDALLILKLLKSEGYKVEWSRVCNPEDMNNALDISNWDIIISDYSMPVFSGMEALKIYKERQLDIPFILVSGTIGEDIAIKMLKSGAHDYIIKDKLNLIIPSIQRELQEYQTRLERNKFYQDLQVAQEVITNSPVVLFQRSFTNNVSELYISENISQFGYIANDFVIGIQDYNDIIHPDDAPKVDEVHNQCLIKKGDSYDIEYRVLCKDGSIRWVNDKTTFNWYSNGSLKYTRGMLIDITARKQADENAIASERRYKELLENIELISVILDTNGNILFCNQYLLSLTGWTYNEVINKNWFELFIPEDIINVLKDEVFDNLISGKVEKFYENDILTKNGDRRSIAWSNSILTDVSGNNIGVSSIGQDITDRLRFERELQQSERLYKSLVETSPDAICMLNLEGTTVFCNQKKAEIFKFDSPDDMVGMNSFELISPDFQYMLPEIKQQLLDNGIITPIEIKFVRHNSETFWGELRSTLIHDEKGNPKYVINVITDIDERKKIQEAWQESEVRFRSAFENAPIGMEFISLTGSLMKVNKAFCDMVGYTAEELANLNFRDFTYSEDLNDNEKYVEQLTSGIRDFVNFEKRYVRKDGRIIWVNVSATLFRNSMSVPLYFITQVEDISQRKQMADEILKAKEKAEESDRLKLALLTNMSHELRTPMNGVLGFTELIMQSKASNEIKDMAQMVAISGKRLMQTIDSIMLLAQLQSSTKSLSFSPLIVSLSEEIVTYTKVYEEQIKSKGLDFVIELQDNVYAEVEPKLFRTAFSVLLENAIKYTQKGFIKITLRTKEQNSIKYACLGVQDTGIGIPEEFCDKIFEEFRQVSEGYDRNYEGVGIGLAITKRIIEIFKGNIAVSSTPNAGSTFTITIPVKDDLDAFEKQAAESCTEFHVEVTDSTQTKDTRILVVEDNQINTKLLVHHISNYCSYIDCATTGEDALEMIKFNEYDAILMDINLGAGIDGLEATKLIREQQKYKKTPIIAVTGYTMLGDKERLISGGCSHYIGKPFTRDSIVSVLKEVLPGFNAYLAEE
ncbi:MAG: PAS domain S-box protein [Candidatus Cloacimonetes bacterium]|nr:PAS domain S-box protein [Candidatus Cloacimonadota bacterium]